MFDQDTVFVDIETTGGNANRDRITEVAILKMQNGKLVSEWSTLINPLTYIPDQIQRLTGIDHEMVRDQPSFQEIFNEVYVRLENSVFVAHNARFDYGFLKNEFKRCCKSFRAPVLCTVKLSRKLFPRYKHHNLDSIMDRHALQCSERHRALGDARVLFDFMNVLYDTHDSELLNDVIKKLLKRPTLPAGVKEEDIESLPSGSGVYMFYDNRGTLLYIGKSKNLRDRVLSHFSSDYRSAKEMKISQSITSIDYIETAGELGASLEESRQIKKQLPIYNKKLRRYDSLVTFEWDFNNEQPGVKIINANQLKPSSIENHYGLFKTKKKAKDTLRKLAKKHRLCEKKIGLESGDGACFAYQLKSCNGVCVGEESLLKHQLRVMESLQPLKNKTWPFKGRIGVKENAYDTKKTDIHIFENWCYLGTAHEDEELKQLSLSMMDEIMFDIDTYKILLRYLKENCNPVIINI